MEKRKRMVREEQMGRERLTNAAPAPERILLPGSDMTFVLFVLFFCPQEINIFIQPYSNLFTIKTTKD